ncbi:MAG: polysaccharide deacetylase family protein [Solirubrobacterales bacterium]|nr:polysaccharide deacetylase family protein [Solirubrobacterales bacterium]
MSDVLVLCYHAVSPTWGATFSVSPDVLERQISLLLKWGWQGARFTDAVLNPPADRTLAVTFDDGFASVFERAAPILSALGVPATVFAPTSFMSTNQELRWDGIEGWRGTRDAHELLCMNWQQLGELADRGWEIGSHTCTHPHLRRLSEEAVREELLKSREHCSEQLGSPCRSVAYPYGEVDGRIADIASEVGYLAGACLSHSMARRGPHLWPRVGVFHGDFELRFRLKVSPLIRSLRAVRVGRSRPLQPLSSATHRST